MFSVVDVGNVCVGVGVVGFDVGSGEGFVEVVVGEVEVGVLVVVVIADRVL